MEKRSRIIPVNVRRVVLSRDGYTCRDCGEQEKKIPNGAVAVATNLHLHHIVEFVNGGEHTPENLITLCYKCHKQRDKEHLIAARKKAYEERRAELAALGYICQSDAARILGMSANQLQTRLRSCHIQTHKHPSFDRYVLLLLDDLEVIKVRDRAA